ncbi:hypothetical protein, partial [Asticcacaulis sp.]|uniref:hypothetical protein n=1 Tax=Asticcacaulis sp. TaxID=1872648 RepID=UPI00391A256D
IVSATKKASPKGLAFLVAGVRDFEPWVRKPERSVGFGGAQRSQSHRHPPATPVHPDATGRRVNRSFAFERAFRAKSDN